MDHEAMVAAMLEVQEEILARRGVSGIEVGYRLVGGRPTNELAICVHVMKKPFRDAHDELGWKVIAR